MSATKRKARNNLKRIIPSKIQYPEETLLPRVTGSKIMSMLDGFSSYNQVLVRKEDHNKTTFTTPWGTFEYIRMPFGLLNAGATFSESHGFFHS
jgi:hypothetical protein